MTEPAVLVLHVAATWALVGLIWTIHVVHYPLFARVGDCFGDVHAFHMRAISWIVGPLMSTEIVTAVWLWLRPPALAPEAPWGIGLALVVGIWAVTGLLAVPAHRRFESGTFDPAAFRRLMLGDRVRALLWTARGVLVGVVLFQVLDGGAL